MVRKVSASSAKRNVPYSFISRAPRSKAVSGGLGSALLDTAVKRKWVTKDLDSRAIRVTNVGRREMLARFGLEVVVT